MATAPKPAAAPKVEKAAPNFKMKLLKTGTELPPNPARTRNVSYTEVIDNLVTLQKTPDRWAEIAHYNAKPGSDKNPTGAKKVVAKFLDGSLKAPTSEESPEAEYDFEWRLANYDGSDREGTVVLAMFIASPEGTVNGAAEDTGE